MSLKLFKLRERKSHRWPFKEGGNNLNGFASEKHSALGVSLHGVRSPLPRLGGSQCPAWAHTNAGELVGTGQLGEEPAEELGPSQGRAALGLQKPLGRTCPQRTEQEPRGGKGKMPPMRLEKGELRRR